MDATDTIMAEYWEKLVRYAQWLQEDFVKKCGRYNIIEST
jgi:hypothetical protein